MLLLDGWCSSFATTIVATSQENKKAAEAALMLDSCRLLRKLEKFLLRWGNPAPQEISFPGFALGLCQGFHARHIFHKLVSGHMPYFWRNFSTRPAVSTIFCLPV